MDTSHPHIMAFLRRNTLKNTVLLKMLNTYPDAIQSYYHEHSPAAGVLILLPTPVSSFDRAAYPATAYVVLLSTTHPEITRALLPYIPIGRPLIFKFSEAHDRQVVETAFGLQRVTAYLSFTAPTNSLFKPSAQVVISTQVDERCFELYALLGYTRPEVEHFFMADQALSFALYQAGQPAAVCFAYRNFDPVYEIGSVYTVPEQRRKGYARQVVETALHTLIGLQRVLRYQVREDNQPSLRLAQTIGLQPFVTLEHWLHNP